MFACYQRRSSLAAGRIIFGAVVQVIAEIVLALVLAAALQDASQTGRLRDESRALAFDGGLEVVTVVEELVDVLDQLDQVSVVVLRGSGGGKDEESKNKYELHDLQK